MPISPVMHNPFPDIVDLGKRIRQARRIMNLTQEQCANKASITSKTLRSIENGRPNVSIGAIISVLDALGHREDLKHIIPERNLRPGAKR